MLRITRQTDYGIVLMTLFIEGHAAEGNGGAAGDGSDAKVMSARDMAAETKLPLPTVSKILKALTRADVLTSTRGVKGGYSLARGATDITVANIIEALEGPIAITDCAVPELERECMIKSSCPCESNWARINDAVRNALSAVRLSDMSAGCRIPFSGLPDEDVAQADLAETNDQPANEQEQDPTA